jgi:hypothetical protein
MKAEWLAPSAWYGHIPFAFWLIENLKPEIFVELGTHYGVSYCAFNQAIQKLQLITKSYGIDTWKGDEHAGFYGEEVYTQLSTYHDQKYNSFSRLVRSTFDEAVNHFADKSIDILHIDGLHSYEAVKHDYETWLPKLSNRSVVLFHDINVRERGFGVWKLWEELKKQYPHFSFLHYHGLGILSVGNNLPETLQAFFSSNSDEAIVVQIREIFARLGEEIPASWFKQQQQKELDNLTQQLEQTHRELNQSQQQLEQAHTKLQQMEAEIKRSQVQLHQAQEGWERSQQMIVAMESSKFWQMRQAWFQIKQSIGLKAH